MLDQNQPLLVTACTPEAATEDAKWLQAKDAAFLTEPEENPFASALLEYSSLDHEIIVRNNAYFWVAKGYIED